MVQSVLKIDSVSIPYIIKEEVIYYPINYIVTKLLQRNKIILKNSKLKDYTYMFDVDFSKVNGGIQNSACIISEGLIKYLDSIKLATLNPVAKDRYYKLCKHLNMSNKSNESQEYDYFSLNSINYYKQIHKDYTVQTCVKCNREYPLDSLYFAKDNRVKSKYTNICKVCNKNIGHVSHNNKLDNDVYLRFGLKGYISFKEDFCCFYDTYILNKKDVTYISRQFNKDQQLMAFKHNYNKGIIDLSSEDFKSSSLCAKFKFNNLNISKNALLDYITDGDCFLRPYKYKVTLNNMTIEKSFDILNTYIEDNEIIIEDIFNYDYEDLLRKAKLTKMFDYKDGLLGYVVKFYNDEYAGYKFKTRSQKYYNNIKNRIFDMKWFVEKDLKIPIHKIPLYVTKYSLHSKVPSLYRVMNKKYESLFDWINECYPNEFNINDFEINPYRSQFDSMEEAQIHDVLKSRFRNLLYNDRKNKNYVSIDGMIPDWLLFTNNNCYLVEYFGLHSDNDISSSHRLQRYAEKTEVKLKKYKELIGYKHLFIYPKDLKDNFYNLNKKLDHIA